MIKTKKSKKKEDSEEEYQIDDIVDSESEEFSEEVPHNNRRNNQGSNRANRATISETEERNQQSQQPIVSPLSTQEKLTNAQIKQYILAHLPEMKEQIESMDDQSLKEVYESVNQSNLREEEEEERKIDQNSNFEEGRSNNEAGENVGNNGNVRDSEIQFMLDEIIKSVPHMRDEVQNFEDKDIRELYESVAGHEASVTNRDIGSRTSVSSKEIQDIKKFLFEKAPEMVNELKYLSDKDILDVYANYLQKENRNSQNKPSIYSPKQGYQNQYSNQYDVNNERTMRRNRYESYEPYGGYSNNSYSNIKMEPRSNYGVDQQQRYEGRFNNYKYGNGNQKTQPFSAANGHFNPSYNPQFSNNMQFHAFHNNQRVPNIPQNSEKYARTIIIFHTMDPGYIPPVPRSNCKCPCCIKRENEMEDENPFNNFIFNLMKKQQLRK